MKTINQLLDLAKKKSNLTSDNQLRLKLGTGSVPRYRNGKDVPNDATAIKIAELCDLPPELVVSICHLAKAKTPEESNLWQHIYKMASAACLVLVLCASLFTPNYAQASGLKSFLSCSIYYPLCDVVNSMRIFIATGIYPACKLKNDKKLVHIAM